MIAYVILTCEAYLPTRAKWQRDSCFFNTDPKNVYYLSGKGSEGVYGWNTADDYTSCPTKYIEFFKNMDLDYDWYVFIDDDAFVFPKRMEKTLSKFDDGSYYIGLLMGHLDNLQFMSGGGGFVLSRKAYNLVKEYIRAADMAAVQQQRPQMIHGDVSMGQWIHNINQIENRIKLRNDHISFSYNPHEDWNLHICETFHYLKEKSQYDFYKQFV